MGFWIGIGITGLLSASVFGLAIENSCFVGQREIGSIPEELFAWPGQIFFFPLLVFWLHNLVFQI
jgi:hypothetical protein